MSIRRVTEELVFLPRWVKKLIIIVMDVALCSAASWVAFSLRYDQFVPYSDGLLFSAVASILIAIPIAIKLGLYRTIYRFSGWFETQSLIKIFSLYALLYSLLFMVLGVPGVPRTIGIIQPVLLFVSVGASRLVVKHVLGNNMREIVRCRGIKLALIYGAGSAGRQIAFGLRHGFEIKPIGFVDDDQRLWNASINGLPVYSPDALSILMQENPKITDIVLAMPSISRYRIKEIMLKLSNYPIHVRALPSLSQLVDGRIKVEDICDVEIEDVLGRIPIPPDDKLLMKNIFGKIVLVTGAGGSIGSELCRQALLYKAKKIILFELNEFSLYKIERELTLLKSESTIVPVLGSVLDEKRLNRICNDHSVETMFHAAAYKHVPMVEINSSAGVWNNVFGTLRAVEAACAASVETFVLVSTDKAVRPTNVMGCTKRVSELILQAKALDGKKFGIPFTKLTMVRFGNVLGSSGSVIPVFSEQIHNGGPITVTHPDIVRYFMTIPEAAQLVIQASAIGVGGDIMLLDMGDQVKIYDLAKRMIHLSGLSQKDQNNPNGDIEIKFTGLRPGEKLYEELLIGDNAISTAHPRIMRAIESSISWEKLQSCLKELECAVKDDNTDAIRGVLKQIVPEFIPLNTA